MSAPEVDATRVAGSDDPPRRAGGTRRGAPRIRHRARDGVSVAAFSLGASVGVSALVWLLLHWLA